MSEEVYKNKQTQEIIRYVREKHGDELEFLWERFSDNSIWRNKKSGKWYGLLMVISKRKLGLDSDEKVEVMDLRFVKNEAREFAAGSENVYPGYHMNKNNWITIILDGSMETERIIALLDQSYRISLRVS